MPKSRLTAGALSAALIVGVLSIPTLQGGAARAAEPCTDAKEVRILNFNDFHGRIAKSGPDTSVFFGTLNELRNDNTLVVSGGDNVGASLFTSAVQHDEPTLNILNTAKIDVSAIGNHELDKGYADLGRILDSAEFPYLSANLTKVSDGSLASADGAYKIFEKNGVKIAVIGAVTKDLPSLISPETFKTIKVGDPVEAVNKYADQLKDGDPNNDEADIVIAAYHEGAALAQNDKKGNEVNDLAAQKAASETFKKIAESSKNVDVILNGHTHQAYAYVDGKRPIVQSASYAELIGQIDLKIGTDSAGKRTVCEATATNVKPKNFTPAKDADAATKDQLKRDRDAYVAANAADVDPVVQDALAKAEELGKPELAKAPKAITRAKKADGSEDRGSRSELSDMVAQMFYEEVGGKAEGTVGIQNPGGTRADLVPNENGGITYAQVAAVLPFANTVMTTEITGAQFKTMLEQQWQPKGASRPVLMMGLSNNVAYTYDEARAEGDRITAIEIDGKPVDPNATYTVVSGSFLIQGGDNFFVLKEGKNTRDTGRADLEAWSSWVKAQETLKAFPRAEIKTQTPAPTEFKLGGAIQARYDATGGEKAYGKPTSNEIDLGGGRVVQHFGDACDAYWAPGAGANFVCWGNKTEWERLGGINGSLGAPTGNEVSLGGHIVVQTFEHGRIYWSPQFGARAVHGGILVRYLNAGGHEMLGVPATGELKLNGGVVQHFAKGLIMWP